MAVTGHSLASLAAADTFKRGGNIVDAAVAASAVTSIILGHAAGIGGDCFLLYRDGRSGRTTGLNASGTAPAFATPEKFANGMKSHGPLAPVVPGLVRAWEAMHTRHGSLPWPSLFDAAIDLAESHPVSSVLASRLASQAEDLKTDPGCARVFFPEGRPIEACETLRQPALARSLRLIAADGADAFYRGEIARDIDAAMERNGGMLRASDLSAYEPVWVEPVSTLYRGHTVHAMPPNSCGALLLMQLNGLSAIEPRTLRENPTLRIGYQMSAMKAAFATGAPLIADPGAVPDAMHILLSEEMAHVMSDAVLSFTNRPKVPESGGTSCLVFADSDGNAISLVQSIFNVFGSMFLDEKTGILFNNRMQGFTHKPAKANTVAPGKRPSHTLCPVLVTREGKFRYALATPGGLSQTLTNAQVLMQLLDCGMDVQAAVEHPRWCNTKTGDFLMEYEFPESLAQELTALGHKVERKDDGYFYGSAKAVELMPSGNLAGGADFRREAFALGV